jgi:plastocyanin
MKTYIGFFMLVMLLVATSGCTTQQAQPATTATMLTTTVAATEVPTVINTPLPTTIPKKVSTTATVPEVTANVTTVATPRSSMIASTKITTIHIRNNTFVPAELTVLPGTGITWVNDDSVTHIVKATGDAKGKFTSTEMMNGAHFGYTFGEATGTYEFMDPHYPDMKGAIIVKKGQSLWSATDTPVTSK